MPKKGTPSPYKGIPRDQWPKVKNREADTKAHFQEMADKAAESPSLTTAFPPPSFTDAVGGNSPNIPRETNKATANFGIPSLAHPAPTDPPIDEIPRNLFSGDQKTLEVMSLDGNADDPIPGFKLYWFNDYANGRIQKALRSGWRFVENTEVVLTDSIASGNTDLGSRVAKVVGSTEGGKPLCAYLMKKPIRLVEAHEREYIEQGIMPLKQKLRRGASTDPENRQFAGGSDAARQVWPGFPEHVIGDTKTYR